jgi:hypothetical protein
LNLLPASPSLQSPTNSTAEFDGEVGWVVMRRFGWYPFHASRHLGMIVALKGVHGVRGTVTV